MNNVVRNKYQGYPDDVRPKMDRLRSLILEVAQNLDGVGTIEETLKWGEPAFLTSASKSGSTIRIDWKPRNPNQYGMYFNCNTTLLDSFRSLHPSCFNYEGDRAIIFDLDETIAENELRQCIALALRYHLDKRNSK